MGQDESYLKSTMKKKDPSFEMPLRPSSLSEFIGQSPIINRLNILIQAAKKRNESLGHLLFSGPPGLGKTTLSQIIAKEMQTNIVISSGPVIDKPGDLAGILTSLKKHDCLFIDEIHRIPRNVEEYLYSAMEDFQIDLMIDSGPNARSVPIQIEPFTLVGATTKSGLLTSPLRTRFSNHLRMEYYSLEPLKKIAIRTSSLLGFPLDDQSSEEIAKRSRGTPRVVNHIIRWVRDYTEIHSPNAPCLKTTLEALEMLSIDEKGLDAMDKKILAVMMDHHNGGPVGLNTLALAVGEEPLTLSEVYEPFLVLDGYIRITPRGRELTDLAYAHLRKSTNNHQ